MRLSSILSGVVGPVCLIGCERTTAFPTSPAPVIEQTLPPAAPAATAGVLRVDSAVMIEFQDDAEPMRWLYAPQVRVTETSGSASVRVTGAEISIPGQAPWVCVTDWTVGAGQTLELFAELYGDFPLAFEKPGQRSGGDALVAVLGQHGLLAVTAPVTPGELPKSAHRRPGHGGLAGIPVYRFRHPDY